MSGPALDDGTLSSTRRSRPHSAGSLHGRGRRPSSGSRRRMDCDADLNSELSGETGGRQGRTVVQMQAPRAIRPSSASSRGSKSSSIARGPIGSTPWQPCIEGGPHTSYSEIGRPQQRPELTLPAEKATHGHKVCMSEIQALLSSSTGKPSNDPGERRFTLCPTMRSRGFCRLPSCPYIHEVCRPRKEHLPLYNANAEKATSSIPCRFLAVLGLCPYADSCVYAHAAASSSVSRPPRAPGSTAGTTPGHGSCSSSAMLAVSARKPDSRSNSVDSGDSEKRPRAARVIPRRSARNTDLNLCSPAVLAVG